MPGKNFKETQDIITIATFYDPFKAQIIKTRLESEGIFCFISDGNLFPTHSFFSDQGGVKLKIRESDTNKVLSIISSMKL